MTQAIKEQFPNLKLKLNEPLSGYTYTKTGGPADVLAFPQTIEEVQALASYAKTKGIPLTILGNASNLIVKDGGIRGIVMMLTEMKQVTMQDGLLVAESGAKLIDVSYRAYDEGLTGLEFACGIPGSIGGAVFMNAGAYDGEISDVLESVLVLSAEGKVQTLSNQELAFSYRHSSIQDNGAIVLEARFKLEKGEEETIKHRMAELTELRESKQPLEYPSCGSVFKRPAGYFTGKLIQDAELQGLVWGGAQVSMKHAGFIVNINQATATDYIELIQHIQGVILEKFGVTLETEVRIIGEDKP